MRRTLESRNDKTIAVARPPASPLLPPGCLFFVRCHGGPKTRIIAALDSKQVTEKTLALGLSEAVNQHDAEAAKEESATAGRGTHVREVCSQDGRMRLGVYRLFSSCFVDSSERYLLSNVGGLALSDCDYPRHV